MSWGHIAGFAAAAAVAVGGFVLWSGEDAETIKLPSAGSPRVVSGWLEGEGTHPTGPAAKVDALERVARQPTELRLAGATAQLDAGTRFRWRREERELTLQAGRVELVAETTAPSSLRIVTSSFRATTLAARFEVTPDVVVVSEGEVRIESLDGTVLAELRGPSRWSGQSPTDSVADATDRALVPAESLHGSRSVNAARLLRQAREAISLGDLGNARRWLRAARAAPHRVADAAEADSLEAELALVSGNVAEAIQRYRDVAERYRTLSAGESALFAAARLTARRNRGAARILFREYVSRYPEGRFLDEAVRHIDSPEP